MKCSAMSCHACSTFDDGCSECFEGDLLRHPCATIVRSARSGHPNAVQVINEWFPELLDEDGGDAADRILAHADSDHLGQKSDDRQFVERAFSECALSVFHLLRRKFYSLNAQDAEDIVGETFAVFTSEVAGGRIDRDRPYRGFITTVAKNKAKDEIKSAQHRKTRPEDPGDLSGIAGASSEAGPEDAAISAMGPRGVDALAEAIASLAPEERLIVRAFLELAQASKKTPKGREVARHLGLDASGQSNFHRKYGSVMDKIKEHPAVIALRDARAMGEEQR